VSHLKPAIKPTFLSQQPPSWRAGTVIAKVYGLARLSTWTLNLAEKEAEHHSTIQAFSLNVAR
jgi:hypothetical protein